MTQKKKTVTKSDWDAGGGVSFAGFMCCVVAVITNVAVPFAICCDNRTAGLVWWIVSVSASLSLILVAWSHDRMVEVEDDE